MKILSVQMEGFGPFKDSQTVDFGAFDDSGIFLIGGRTGAGKSTILDALCFALYGSVPRYDGYSGTARLRSDHCDVEDETRVTLTFEADGSEYRVVRNPEFERPKLRGEGTTTQPARAELAELVDGEWEVRETKAREIGERLAEIVKLDKEQFLQVILLAQNRFQEFLEAESRERQSLLRTLFDTRRFDDYAKDLQARAQAHQDQLSSLTDDAERTVDELALALAVGPPSEGEDRQAWAQGQATAEAQQLEVAIRTEALALAHASKTGEVLRATEQLAAHQRSREAARARLGELNAQSDLHARNKQRLDAAQRAAAVGPYLAEADRAVIALEDAQREASAALAVAGDVPDGDLDEIVRELGQQIGALSHALEIEARLQTIQTDAVAAKAALAAHDHSTAQIDTQRVALRESRSELDDREGPAAAAASELSATQQQIMAVETAAAAAARLTALEAEVQARGQAELAALAQRTEATKEHERLRTLQLNGRSAVLAQTLLVDEPCPVCGALEHPHPAQFSGELVTDEQVEIARRRLERAHDAVDEVARALRDAESRTAEQRGAAGGRSSEALQHELEQARERYLAAQQAQAELSAIAQARDQIAQQLDGLERQERSAAALRAQLAQAEALSQQAMADAESLIDRSRSAHQTVSANAEHLKRRQGTLESVIGTRAQLIRFQAAQTAATAALSTSLTQAEFPDRAAAEMAMLADSQRAALATQIREHEDGLTQLRALLDQPDLRDAPEEAVDVSAAQRLAADAGERQRESTVWRVNLETRVRRARELTAKLESELESSADLEREYKVLGGLAAAIRGDHPNRLGIPLESFVLAAELEEIVAAANGRLRTMSQGRYSIEHSDERTRGGKRTGLEILVYDAHTGAARSPHSLSGGEKFLASLALALGLAEVVTARAGGIRLDTLFIDEGFGSLDNETLEVAMHTLDELRQGGRTVGLISHVDAMKDQIPARLLVDVADAGWSVISQTV